jgi:hypothetical protein
MHQRSCREPSRSFPTPERPPRTGSHIRGSNMWRIASPIVLNLKDSNSNCSALWPIILVAIRVRICGEYNGHGKPQRATIVGITLPEVWSLRKETVTDVAVWCQINGAATFFLSIPEKVDGRQTIDRYLGGEHLSDRCPDKASLQRPEALLRRKNRSAEYASLIV